jgi:hypothetical protein
MASGWRPPLPTPELPLLLPVPEVPPFGGFVVDRDSDEPLPQAVAIRRMVAPANHQDDECGMVRVPLHTPCRSQLPCFP